MTGIRFKDYSPFSKIQGGSLLREGGPGHSGQYFAPSPFEIPVSVVFGVDGASGELLVTFEYPNDESVKPEWKSVGYNPKMEAKFGEHSGKIVALRYNHPRLIADDHRFLQRSLDQLRDEIKRDVGPTRHSFEMNVVALRAALESLPPELWAQITEAYRVESVRPVAASGEADTST